MLLGGCEKASCVPGGGLISLKGTGCSPDAPLQFRDLVSLELLPRGGQGIGSVAGEEARRRESVFPPFEELLVSWGQEMRG